MPYRVTYKDLTDWSEMRYILILMSLNWKMTIASGAIDYINTLINVIKALVFYSHLIGLWPIVKHLFLCA